MRPKTNHLSKEAAIARVKAEPFSRTSISFYRYVKISDPAAFRDALWETWDALGILGRIYVAEEGINAQLSCPTQNIDAFRASVDGFLELKDVPFKIGVEEKAISFWKLTIKVRPHILAHGLSEEEFNIEEAGEHLSAKDFNEAIEQGATVVDMRNNYESKIGRFEGAICPDAETFRDELDMVVDELKGKEDEPVLLYCTGGIRCEPASAYLKKKGFKRVNQLFGGVINYKHQVDKEGLESKYKGKNFVFDGRTVETITDDVLAECLNCGSAYDVPTNCKNDACHALFIQCIACAEELNGCCKTECQRIAALPLEEQKKLRAGAKVGRNVLM